MRRFVPALLSVALVLLVVSVAVPSAHAKPNGRFLAVCGYSHSRPDDPIARPGQPGRSHVHDFLGNTTTNAFSTYGSMTGAPGSARPAPVVSGSKAASGTGALDAYRLFLGVVQGAFASPAAPAGSPGAAVGSALAPVGSPAAVGSPGASVGSPAAVRPGGPPGVPATRCRAESGDTASYWTPAVYRNGVKVDPIGSATRQQIYYDRSNLRPGTKVEVIPADLRVKAGVSTARTLGENPKVGREIYWGCSDNSTSGKAAVPPARCRTGIITLHVGFPNCWDGVLTHVDDTAHLAYPKSGRCLAPFTRVLPRVILRWEYPVGKTTGLITLSSGSLATIHGDFWNTWQQAPLARLVNGCINAGRDCGKR